MRLRFYARLTGTTNRNAPSRFLADIPGNVLEGNVESGMLNVESAKNPTFNPLHSTIRLAPGDRIRHRSFGEGIVASINGDELVATFAGMGTKKLSPSFAPVEKIG